MSLIVIDEGRYPGAENNCLKSNLPPPTLGPANAEGLHVLARIGTEAFPRLDTLQIHRQMSRLPSGLQYSPIADEISIK
jgi:hypothetical protein